jgi:hypothetical protein
VGQIGNALGFVRQVRMGQQHHSTAAAQFMPTNSSSTKFEATAKTDGLSGALHFISPQPLFSLTRFRIGASQ